MISVDTSVMRNLVSAASTANDAINDAVEILSRISSHNDWQCKEKDAINDYTNTNKTKIRNLQENSNSFLNAISSAANEFEEAEKSILNMFSSVESILSGVLSFAGNVFGAGESSGGFASTFSNTLKDVMGKVMAPLKDGNIFDSFIHTNTFNPIHMCNFAYLNHFHF